MYNTVAYFSYIYYHAPFMGSSMALEGFHLSSLCVQHAIISKCDKLRVWLWWDSQWQNIHTKSCENGHTKGKYRLHKNLKGLILESISEVF